MDWMLLAGSQVLWILCDSKSQTWPMGAQEMLKKKAAGRQKYQGSKFNAEATFYNINSTTCFFRKKQNKNIFFSVTDMALGFEKAE